MNKNIVVIHGKAKMGREQLARITTPINLRDLLSTLRIILMLLTNIKPTIRSLRSTLVHEHYEAPENMPYYDEYISLIDQILDHIRETPNLGSSPEESADDANYLRYLQNVRIRIKQKSHLNKKITITFQK